MALYETGAAGDMNSARNMFYAQPPILRFILQGALPTTIKAGRGMRGFEAGVRRSPLLGLSTEGIKSLQTILASIAFAGMNG